MTRTHQKAATFGAVATALIALPLLAGPAANAEPTDTLSTPSTPQLELALNDIYQQADPDGRACPYFSAGKHGRKFVPEEAGVHIIKRTAEGTAIPTLRSNICFPEAGETMNQRAAFTNGTGHLDPKTGAGELRWSGAFTANAYNGLVPWWIENPVLTVTEDGSGTLRAEVGGKGSSMLNPYETFPVTSRTVTLANFSRVTLTETGLSFMPAYDGVEYYPLRDFSNPESGRSTTSAIPAEDHSIEGWGAWPESIVDFHYETGLSSYWHTSGGGADPVKRPLPVTVYAAFDAPATETAPAEAPAPDEAAAPAPAEAAAPKPEQSAAPAPAPVPATAPAEAAAPKPAESAAPKPAQAQDAVEVQAPAKPAAQQGTAAKTAPAAGSEAVPAKSASPKLALTGGGNAGLAIGLAASLLLGGGAVMLFRSRRARLAAAQSETTEDPIEA